MKAKYIFAASLLAAGAAFADTTEVETSYVVGVLPVSISGKEVILSIPWIESGTKTDGVAVVNLIKTAGLDTGDSLLWYDTENKGFQGWHIEQEGGVNVWKPSATVSATDVTAVAATQSSLYRGQAIILSRSASTATTIYIVGGDPTGVSATDLTLAPNSFTLFAPPSVSASGTAINSLTWGSVGNITTKDYIVLADGTQVKYRNSKWIAYSYDANGSLVTNENPVIPVGTGAWYVSKGESVPTVSW